MKWLVGRWWFWLAAVAILFAQPIVRTLFREPPRLPPVGAPFPVVQNLPDLGGRVWIAGVLDAKHELLPILQKVQNRLRHMGDSYRIITFCEKPSDDLAREAHANPRSWRFVSGDPGALRSALAQPADSLALYLIDQKGKLRGRFDPRLASDEDDLVATLGLLVNNY